MSNSTTTKKLIYLDTFSSAITVSAVKVFSIEWIPENIGDECKISMDSDSPNYIEWVCHTEFYPHIKYFDAQPIGIYIAVGGVGSGKVIIYVR